MAHRITGIDHVLIAVRDLEAAAQAFARLGFTLSPPGRHPEWGTANRCLMFAGGYVELLAMAGDDPHAGPGAAKVAAHLASHGEGLMGIALGTSDAAEASASLQRAGIAAAAPAALSRFLDAPEGRLAPRFSVVDLPSGSPPGLPAFLCQHLTPELLRRPEWLRHANGALAVQSVTVVVEQPERLMGDYNRVFGPAASTPTDDMVTVHTGGGLVYLVEPEGFEQLHPGFDMLPPPPPALAVLSVTVADLEATAAQLKAAGIGVTRKGSHLSVDPEDALGVALEFAERR